MLSHERYGHARAALVNQLQEGIKKMPNPETLFFLLSEHYKTQLALEKLGVTVGTPPSELPQINLIYPPQTPIDRSKIVSISLIGMPNAAKTETLEVISDTYITRPPIVDELFRQVRAELFKRGSFKYDRTMIEVFKQQDEMHSKCSKYLYEMATQDEYFEPLVLSDRLVWTDLPMLRALFLFGRISQQSFLRLEKLLLGKLLARTQETTGIVIGLILPEESMQREEYLPNPTPILNIPFLQILYEQYLRYYWELKNFQQVYRINRPFSFSAVDASGMDNWKTFRSFEKRISEIYFISAPT